MTSRDPATCRRALQEIREIAAAATLQDSQMSDQEALQTIAAIAGWVAEEGAAERMAPAAGHDARPGIPRPCRSRETPRRG